MRASRRSASTSSHATPSAPERVLAHSDIAPGRKRDPGEKFDWAAVWPVRHRSLDRARCRRRRSRLGSATRARKSPRLQAALTLTAMEWSPPVRIGHGDRARWCEAFQLHFRPPALTVAPMLRRATLDQLLAERHGTKVVWVRMRATRRSMRKTHPERDGPLISGLSEGEPTSSAPKRSLAPWRYFRPDPS